MSIIEPGQDRTIGPDPVGPAPEPDVTALVADQVTEPEPAAEPDTFDREYVEKLRAENARYRTRAKEWEEVAGSLDDEDRQAWLQIIGLANSGDPDALAYLGQALGFTQEQPEPQPQEDLPEYLTREQAMELAREIAREEAQQALTVEQQQRAQQEQITTIQSRAKSEFGIEPGSDDYVLLLKYANEIDPIDLPEGTDLLSAANDMLKQKQQQAWDAYIAQKEAEAQTSPTIASGNGQAPSTAQTPKSFAEAREALHERLSNLG